MADEKKQIKELSLDEVMKAFIWEQPPVDVVPIKTLDSWSIVKVIEAKIYPDKFGFHFVGRDIKECNGAVSSKIAEFDPEKLQGKTESGRIYQLIGRPGQDGDAQYVLHNWRQLNQLVTANVTHDFLKSYGVSTDDLLE